MEDLYNLVVNRIFNLVFIFFECDLFRKKVAKKLKLKTMVALFSGSILPLLNTQSNIVLVLKLKDKYQSR